MDLESECSVLVSAEDNREIKSVSGSDKLGNTGESEVHYNGCYEVDNHGNNGSISDVNGKGAQVSRSVSPPPVGVKSEASPSSSTRKGYGLKKWRRIRRDLSKVGDSSVDSDKTVMQEPNHPPGNPSKRTQVYAEKPQKSEGSVSSTNAVVGNFDIFALLGDSGLGMGPSLDVGTDSENSEDRSSKSSTAASIPKLKYELPAVLGFPHDKSRSNSMSGNSLTHSGQQGKGRIETIKKAREERVKLEKENSHSSLESDSRSSNFVFMQGTYSASNGMRSERPVHHDGENGDEVQGSEQQVGDGYYSDGKGGYGDIPSEDGVADSSSNVKKERRENNGTSSEQDPLAESIFELKRAQEALEREVLMFKEINKESSVNGPDSTLPEFTDLEQLPSVQSDGLEIANRDVETDLEDIFKKKIEAEVLYLAISRTVEKQKVASVDRSTISEEQKAAMPKKEGEKSEDFREEIARADEMLKLHKRVYKYTWCFFVQLLALFLILGFFIFQLSRNYAEVVPT